MKCTPGSFIQDYSLFLLLCCVNSHIFMQGICDAGKVLNNAPVVPNKSDKTFNGSVCGGFRVFYDGFQIILLGHTPFKEILCPKYSIFSLKNSHLEGLNFSPWSQKCSNTALKHLMCSSCILE